MEQTAASLNDSSAQLPFPFVSVVPHVSRAFAKRTTAVSLFRINVRLGGRHKCHSVRLPRYQVMASRAPRGIAASEDSPGPCIS